MSNDKMGGAAAVLTGLLGGSFVVLTLIGSPASYDEGLVSRYAVLADYALALAGLAGLAALPALSSRVSELAPGWMGWVSKVGLLGFALLAILNFWQAEADMVSSDAAYDTPALPYGMINDEVAEVESSLEIAIDVLLARFPHGWIEVAGIGLWMLSVSWLAMYAGLLPSGLSGTGVAAGFLAFCAAAGANLDIPVLHLLGTLGWSVVLPVWFIWAGGFLLLAGHRALAEQAAQPMAMPDARLAERAPEPPRRKRRSTPLIRLWPS